MDVYKVIKHVPLTWDTVTIQSSDLEVSVEAVQKSKEIYWLFGYEVFMKIVTQS